MTQTGIEQGKSNFRLAYIVTTVAISCLLIGASLGIIIQGSPASAPPTTIDWEGLVAYKINGIRYALDGTPDAIQDAIDDLPMAGGLVVVPNGTFDFSSQFSVSRNNIAITGSGATTIHQSTDGNGLFIVYEKENVTIANFQITGYAGASNIATAMHVDSNSTHVTFYDLTIMDWFGYPFGSSHSSNVRFENIRVVEAQDTTATGNPGGVFVQECQDVIIDKCAIEGGVQISGSTTLGISLLNSNLTKPPYAHGGAYVFMGAGHVNIQGNSIFGFSHAGVELRGDNCTVSSNQISGNTDGIEIFDSLASETNVRDNIIMGNIIHDNVADGIKIYSAAGTNPPARITITANSIQNNGAYGIDAPHTTVKRLTISYNMFKGNVAAPVHCLSPYSVVSFNTLTQTPASPAIRIASNCSAIGNNLFNSTYPAAIGIFVGTNQADFIISDNQIEGFYGGLGISLSAGCSRFTISGNSIRNLVASGTSYGILLSGSYFGVISGNTISHVNGAGMLLSSSCYGVTITGNSVSLNERRGIYVSACQFITIIGNSVNDNSRASSNTYAAIDIGTSENCTVIGNIAVNTPAYSATQYKGLISSTTSTNNIVIGNIFTPNLSGNYTLVGTNYVYGNL